MQHTPYLSISPNYENTFSEQHGAFSSLSCLPSESDSEGGEDEEDDNRGLLGIRHSRSSSPTPTSTATITFTSRHTQQRYILFKNHYQRVVARENALEESGVSSSSPSYLALCKPPPPPPTLTPAASCSPASGWTKTRVSTNSFSNPATALR